MSETTLHPEDPVLEDARRRLQAIIDPSSTGASGFWLQQIAEAGLLVLDTLPPCPEAQQLAEIIAQQVDDIYSHLQNIARIDDSLENDLLEFLGAIFHFKEEIPNLSGGTAIEKLVAFGDNLQELSARIVWHIVANDDSELTIPTKEEANCPLHSKLTSHITTENGSPVLNLLDCTKYHLGASAPGGETVDLSSQSIAINEFMALFLRLGRLSGTRGADTTITDQLPGPSAILTDSTSNSLYRGQVLDAEETHQLGLDLLKISMQKGQPRNLSNSILAFRECLILCSSDSQLRLKASENLATALLTRTPTPSPRSYRPAYGP